VTNYAVKNSEADADPFEYRKESSALSILVFKPGQKQLLALLGGVGLLGKNTGTFILVCCFIGIVNIGYF
jgi:hypothetical protein